VRLYPATQPKDVRFHLYDRRTGKRVRYERVVRADETASFAPDADLPPPSYEPEFESRAATRSESDAIGRPMPAAQPVGSEDVVRGVELDDGELVTVTEDEFESLAPERSRTIELEEFVELAEIDPVFFEKSYHLAPARRMGAEKPYILLLKALQGAGMVGIGRFVLRTRPHLVAIRPLERSLALETLFFGDEVRSPEELAVPLADIAVSDREVKTARQLITAMATEWSPSAHADEYREQLLTMLRSKAPAGPAPVDATAVSDIGDLMAALRTSVEAAKARQHGKASSSKRAG
jgi:DNA end-binding protein Ku